MSFKIKTGEGFEDTDFREIDPDIYPPKLVLNITRLEPFGLITAWGSGQNKDGCYGAVCIHGKQNAILEETRGKIVMMTFAPLVSFGLDLVNPSCQPLSIFLRKKPDPQNFHTVESSGMRVRGLILNDRLIEAHLRKYSGDLAWLEHADRGLFAFLKLFADAINPVKMRSPAQIEEIVNPWTWA